MIKFIITFVLISITSSLAFAQSPQPQDAQSYFEEGLRLMRDRSFEGALASFERSAALDSKQPATFANIGAVLINLKRYEAAETAFRSAIRLAPAKGSFHSEFCRALSLQKKHAEAIKECEDGVRLDPGSDMSNTALFIAMRTAGRPTTELLAYLDAAAARFRDSEVVLALAADYYLAIRNYQLAGELLQRLTTLKPNSSIYYGRLAESYLRLERDTDALAAARKALEIDSQDPYANYGMGLIFFELGQHEEAAESFARVESGIESLRFAEYYRAVSNSRQGRSNEAIGILRNLTTQFPAEYEFHLELGSLLNSESRYEDAIAPLRKAVELRPKSLEAQSGLGLSLFESAHFDQAIPVLQEALRISPGNEIVTMFLNVTRARQQQAPRIEEMKKFAAENPEDLNVRMSLVQALAHSRRIDEADAYVKEIYAGKPRDIRFYQHIAVSYSTAGKYEKAEEAYQKSLLLEQNPAAYLGMASIHARRGQIDVASAAYAKVIELKPDSPNIMILYAIHLRNNGKRRESLEMFKRSLSIQPSNGTALFGAGMLSARLNERENANLYLEQLRVVDPKLARQLERCLRLRVWG